MKVIHFIGINRKFRIAGFLSAFLLVTLCGLTFLPVSFQDKHVEAATGTAAESTITLDVANSVASVDLTVNSSNGTFATSASNDEASFSVVTNNYTGYTLSISADDNTGELVNGEESLSSIESAISASTFDSSTYNGLWGYKPSKLNSASNTNYLPSPTTEATTLDVTNAANNEANTYTIGLGARTDYTKPNGTYSKTFILTAVANKINYSVTYNKNTTDTVTNMPYASTNNVQSGDTGSTSITLSDLVPVRDGYTFKGWCSVATSDETCSGTAYNPDGAGTNLTYGIDQTTLNIGTLYAMWESAETKCDSSKLCVQYEGNGLAYDGDRTVNRVNYSSTTTQQEFTKYSYASYTSSGEYNGYTQPAGNNVVTIDGATSLHITVTYGVPQNAGGPPSEFYIWAGDYPDYTNSDNTTSLSSCGSVSATNGAFASSGSSGSQVTMECDIASGSVTFYDYGQYGVSTGYYAVVTGAGTALSRTVSSGEYATPTGTNAIFHGWSSTQTTAGGGLPSQVEYTNESEVMSKMPGNEGEAKTLYAVWQQGYNITFNKDSNVSSIAVLDSDGNTVGTITSSGQNLTLYDGNTYTIKPTHTTGYTTNTITKTSGAGTIGNYTYKMGGAQFTVGAGAATISITSKVMQPMQNWTGCSSLAVGDTEQVYDTRDNEVYLVGKLADNKCWMLDNLRLDLGNTTVLDDTTASNTNASVTSLNYMKNGGGTTSDQYPTAKINNEAWTSSSQNYYSIPMTISTYKDQTTTSYGSGSGKIGVYYNFCAASAGSYCYGNGTSAGTSSGNAEEDICPAGWRMPTGGSSGEYQALYTAYSSNATNFRNALSTPLSGGFYNGSAYDQGSYGRFWSSTRDSGSYMYNLSVYSSNVYPQGSHYRGYGYSVRCLLDGRKYLQDQTSTTLATDLPNVGDTGIYVDKRDGEEYLIGHLVDGKYWMLDNLRLDLGNSTVLANTTADNTNASATSLNYMKNGGGTTSDQYPTAKINNEAWTSSSQNYYSIPMTVSSGNGWDKDTTVTSYGSGSGKIGVYYNFCAASAGSYCYGNGTSAGTSSGNAEEDICPAGWRMPTGGSSGEYQALYTAYSSNATNFRNALSTPLSGYFYDGSANDQGSGGVFWSSTRSNVSFMYLLYVYSSFVYPQSDDTRDSGFSVRCFLR